MKKEHSAKAGDADHAILFTGFPGFIGMRLLPRILDLNPHARIECLVQEKFLDPARKAVEVLEGKHRHARGRIDLVVGDITVQGLGIELRRARELRGSLKEAYHLAAVYDLTVSREVGRRINVEGTKNVLEFLDKAPHFERLHYVSTAYVSGTARGVYRETDLDVGQGFKNYYEETKFQAEVEVVRSRSPPYGLPAWRRGGGFEDRRDREVRRSLLRAPGHGATPPARPLRAARSRLRHRQRGADRFRGGGARPALVRLHQLSARPTT